MPRGEENVRFLEKFLGQGPSVSSDLGDLLISGGLNLLSGRGAGRGNLAAIAESYKDPYASFAKARAFPYSKSCRKDLAVSIRNYFI